MEAENGRLGLNETPADIGANVGCRLDMKKLSTRGPASVGSMGEGQCDSRVVRSKSSIDSRVLCELLTDCELEPDACSESVYEFAFSPGGLNLTLSHHKDAVTGFAHFRQNVT